MHVVFVTRRTDHQINDNPLITVVDPKDYNIHSHLLRRGKSKIKEPISYSDWYLLGYDIETQGWDPLTGKVLLSAFCDEDEEVLVVDNTSVDIGEIFTPDILKRCFFIAHNADFEARWGVTNNFLPMRFGCTMVNDKRLLSGEKGYHFDIISVINRRLGYKAIPQWMEKDIRNSFAECTFFTAEQILYNSADTIRLKSLYQEQLREAATINQLYLHNSINSRLIIPIAKAEVTGIKHDSERWINIAKERQVKANEICKELDELVLGKYKLIPGTINPLVKKKEESQRKQLEKASLRKVKLEKQLKELEEKGKTHLKSYRVQQEQLEKINMSLTSQTDGSGQTQTRGGLVGVINWGSSKQVLEVLRQLECPNPLTQDKATRKPKAGVGKEARANWFVANEGSEFEPLMKKFDEFKKIQHNIKSFGEKWVEQYVRNGRAYTALDQAGTDTGRFSSGSKGKTKVYANMQQIPKFVDKATKMAIYRACFIADEGRSIGTLDYSNCEGSVMTALARELNMMKILQLDDSHSYLGTKSWRNIYKSRYERTGLQEWKELSENYQMSKETPEKEKERDIFKNSGGLFPVAYGVAAAKVAATSKISPPEGQIMINTIKAEIPLVITFLDKKSKEAVQTGYVIHNARTGSRRGFTAILDYLHYGYVVSKSDKAEVEFQARNSPIQGEIVPCLNQVNCWNIPCGQSAAKLVLG